MATYHWDKNGKMVEGRAPRRGSSAKGPMIMPDIKPYKAVAGDMAGKEISGRKAHREFLRRNGFEEVGNEKKYVMRNGMRIGQRVPDAED